MHGGGERRSNVGFTIDQSVEDVLSVLLHQVIDVPEDSTAFNQTRAHISIALILSYHMVAIYATGVRVVDSSVL